MCSMNRQVKCVGLTLFIEKADHGGDYCSGDECEYFTDNINVNVPLPKILEHTTDVNKFINYDWKYLEMYIKILDWGSGYCGLSNECVEHGLNKHEYRITIVDAKIITGLIDDQLLKHYENDYEPIEEYADEYFTNEIKQLFIDRKNKFNQT